MRAGDMLYYKDYDVTYKLTEECIEKGYITFSKDDFLFHIPLSRCTIIEKSKLPDALPDKKTLIIAFGIVALAFVMYATFAI